MARTPAQLADHLYNLGRRDYKIGAYQYDDLLAKRGQWAADAYLDGWEDAQSEAGEDYLDTASNTRAGWSI